MTPSFKEAVRDVLLACDCQEGRVCIESTGLTTLWPIPRWFAELSRVAAIPKVKAPPEPTFEHRCARCPRSFRCVKASKRRFCDECLSVLSAEHGRASVGRRLP